MATDATAVGESIRDYLGMACRPVGIKLHATVANHLARPDQPMRYCHAVREAAKGRDFLFRQGDQICKKAEVILGFRDPKIGNIEPRIKNRIQAISIGPLQDADQIVFILNPEQAMTMAVLLGGIACRFTGRFSICGEITARVALDNEPKFSFLCDGARRYAEYTAEEVALGVPYDLFLKLPERMNKYRLLAHKAAAGLRQLFQRAK